MGVWRSVCCCACDSVPRATLCGTTIFSFGSPGTKMLESPLVTRRPSGAMVVFLMRNLILLLTSLPFVVGTFPVVRCSLAALQESLCSCAASRAALLKNDASNFSGVHLAAGSTTVFVSSLMNLWIAHVCASQLDGWGLWWSEILLRLYLPLRCFTTMGILLMFERNLFILELVENLPSWWGWWHPGPVYCQGEPLWDAWILWGLDTLLLWLLLDSLLLFRNSSTFDTFRWVLLSESEPGPMFSFTA